MLLNRGALKKKLEEGVMPRYLRAVEKTRYKVHGGGEREGSIHHYVEWHGGEEFDLVKLRSHTQLCLYADLGDVSCEWQFEKIVLKVRKQESAKSWNMPRTSTRKFAKDLAICSRLSIPRY